jgi:hypothetical protein
MRKAYLKAGKAPKRILTDGLKVYPDAVDLVFGGETRHIVSKPFVEVDSTNVIERFQGTLKDRTKVMRGFKKPDTATLILDGWLVYYNYLRPHESLGDKTPARIAGINFPYQSWQDIVKSQTPLERDTQKPPTMPSDYKMPSQPRIKSRRKKPKPRRKPRVDTPASLSQLRGL